MSLDQEFLRLDVALEVEPSDSMIAIDFLLDNVELSKSRLKDIMNKGAVWLKRGKSPKQRLRRAMTDLKVGDILELYYDERLLSLKPSQAKLVDDQEVYSVWNKPAGMLTQGTEWCDHTSLLRQVELHFHPRREVFLIDRLDREASGLVIIAHSRKTASQFSNLLQDNGVEKKYRIEVLGELGQAGEQGEINADLDDKACRTRYQVVKYEPHTNASKVDVWVDTERKHQVRRHFESIGHPVMGDPKYGQGNKNREGLKLSAVELTFECPVRHKTVSYSTFNLRPSTTKNK
jgi:tRNA pseudouridine32 synthase/23S rRNA pseudouridine746 synthase